MQNRLTHALGICRLKTLILVMSWVTRHHSISCSKTRLDRLDIWLVIWDQRLLKVFSLTSADLSSLTTVKCHLQLHRLVWVLEMRSHQDKDYCVYVNLRWLKLSILLTQKTKTILSSNQFHTWKSLFSLLMIKKQASDLQVLNLQLVKH